MQRMGCKMMSRGRKGNGMEYDKHIMWFFQEHYFYDENTCIPASVSNILWIDTIACFMRHDFTGKHSNSGHSLLKHWQRIRRNLFRLFLVMTLVIGQSGFGR